MRVQPFESPLAAPGQVEEYAPAIVAEQALQQLLRYPRLPEVMRRLQAIARAEAKKRRYFYEVVTEQQKAEFINGEIIVHSPVKYQHNQASFRLATLLSAYVQRHNLGTVGHENLLITLTRNDYEPYLLHEGAYRLAVKVKTGSIASAVVTGFEIPVRAVFDAATQLATLQAILAG